MPTPLYAKTGKRPDPEIIAEEMGIKVKEAIKLQTFVDDVAPLDNLGTVSEDNGRGIPESIEPRKMDPAIHQIEIDQELEEIMKQLNDREQRIIRFRYGVADGRAHTLEETGRHFSLTRERIRQIENDVMKRLRKFVAERSDEFGR